MDIESWSRLVLNRCTAFLSQLLLTSIVCPRELEVLWRVSYVRAWWAFGSRGKMGKTTSGNTVANSLDVFKRSFRTSMPPSEMELEPSSIEYLPEAAEERSNVFLLVRTVSRNVDPICSERFAFRPESF